MDPLSVARNIIAEEIGELRFAANKTTLETKINELVKKTMDFVDNNIIDNKILNLNEKINVIAKLTPDILIMRKEINNKNFESIDKNIMSLYTKIKNPENKDSSTALTDEELEIELEDEMSSIFSKLVASENEVDSKQLTDEDLERELELELENVMSSAFSKLPVPENKDDSKVPKNQEDELLDKINNLPKPSNEKPLPSHLFLKDNEKLKAKSIFASSNILSTRATDLNREFFKDKAVGTFFVIDKTHAPGSNNEVNYMCIKGKKSIIHMIPVDKKDLNEKEYAEILKNLKNKGEI